MIMVERTEDSRAYKCDDNADFLHIETRKPDTGNMKVLTLAAMKQ
jgi:hypothetical protein